MFKNPFSFDGRIRRTEYGISIIFYSVFAFVINYAITIGGVSSGLFVLYIPLLWFLWAQGAKRCHDRGNSGWYQIIPFYGFWMLFADGEVGENEFGENPKESATTTSN